MKQYEKYKASGFEWLGNIPEHWSVVPFKRSVSINNGRDYKHIVSDIGFPVIGSGGQFAYASGYMYDGEVVFFGRKGTIDRPLYFHGKFWAVDTIFYAVAYKNSFTKYLYYQALNFPFNLYSTSTALPSMTQTDLGNNPICFPSRKEQQAIARYLDYTVGKVDELIDEKMGLIAKLQEQRKAIINEVVTKGLNHNASMRPSGIDWLGDIPEHWGTSKIKYLAELKSGSNLISEQIDLVGDFPVYGGNGIRGYYSLYSNEGHYVLIGRQGALCGNINYANGKFWATEHAVICYPKCSFQTIWFGELLRSMNLNQYSIASAQPGLAVERIKNISIPYPDFSEQTEIVNYIESRTAKIDQAITELANQIEKLKEYKTAIISEAVTGKVDVRDWQLPTAINT